MTRTPHRRLGRQHRLGRAAEGRGHQKRARRRPRAPARGARGAENRLWPSRWPTARCGQGAQALKRAQSTTTCRQEGPEVSSHSRRPFEARGSGMLHPGRQAASPKTRLLTAGACVFLHRLWSWPVGSRPPAQAAGTRTGLPVSEATFPVWPGTWAPPDISLRDRRGSLPLEPLSSGNRGSTETNAWSRGGTELARDPSAVSPADRQPRPPSRGGGSETVRAPSPLRAGRGTPQRRACGSDPAPGTQGSRSERGGCPSRAAWSPNLG